MIFEELKVNKEIVQGLKEMGLVETTEEKGRIAVKLSMLGILLVKGYVSS